MPVTWTADMDAALRRYTGTISPELLGEIIGVDKKTAVRRQVRLGIFSKLKRGRKPYLWTPERDALLRKRWANPRIPAAAVGAPLGCVHVVCWKRAKELGLGRKAHIWRQR